MNTIGYKHKCYFYTQEINVYISESQIEIDKSESLDFDIEKPIFSFIVNNSNEVELNVSDSKPEILTNKNIVAAVDALFLWLMPVNAIKLVGLNHEFVTDTLTKHDLGIWIINGKVYRDIFYQQHELCINLSYNSYAPSKYVTDNGKYHPIRPLIKKDNAVYRRYIPWLKATLSFRVFDIEQHLSIFNEWMNEPDVEYFWEEAGSLEKHKSYIEPLLASNSHSIPLIGYFDEEPFGYFEVYWAKEDRIGAYYQCDDYDRGWHVLIGAKNYRGKDFVAAWMPSISHYIYLSDCRTRRVVIEPRIDNYKMQKSLYKNGYAYIKNFDFPHKRAMLHILNREHFFSSNFLFPSEPSFFSNTLTSLIKR